MDGKIILLDYGFYLHSAGWCAVNANSTIPAGYTCFNMMLSDLLKVGIEPEDMVIVGIDYHGEDYSSWRKQYSDEYKEGRQKLPDSVYAELNDLTVKLNNTTEWHFIKLEHLEFDDIASVACRYFTDNEIVIVSADCDMEQLWIYDNIKIFSPHKKSKRYKIKPDNFNVYKILAKKIRKEAKDQVKSEVLNEEDYETRRLIMDLTQLPDWVENMTRDAFDRIQYKQPCIPHIPFRKLADKYATLYDDKSKIVTYEQSVKKEETKKKRKSKKRKEKIQKERSEENEPASKR